MRIETADVGGARLELELGSAEAPRTIVMADIAELAGALAISAGDIALAGASLARVTVASATWTTGRATIEVDHAATATGVTADLHIARAVARESGTPALRGTITAATVHAPHMVVDAGGRSAFGLELHDVRFAADDEGDQHLTIARAIVRELQGSRAGAIVRAPAIELRAIDLSAAGGHLRLAIGGARAASASVSRAELELTLEGLELPGGITVDGPRLEIPALQVAALQAAVESLPGPRAAGDDEPARAPLPIDLEILDQLSGRFEVDLDVDITVPVIGRRKATHRLRVPIESGAIDYKELEADLSSLEDAFIDFELDDDRLILERRIPLIPGTGKPILIWDLPDAAEMELARRDRVRLRRLPSFRVAADKKTRRQGPPSVELRHLAANDIDLLLSLSASRAAIALDGGGHELEGWLRRASLGELRAHGALFHDPGEAPAPSTISVTGRELELGLAGVPLGSATLDAVAVAIATIESVVVGFVGVRPRSIGARLVGVSLEDLNATLNR